MKTSKLELMQSGLERRKEADQLNASLQLLSKTLRDFLTLTEQSELPIMQSTMLLGRMEETIKAIESNLISISTEIENLSPQPLKTTMVGYLEQLETIKSQLSHIDLSKIKTLSVSVQALQAEIDKAINSISIDQKQIQVLIQFQVKQAIESQAEFVQTEIQSLLQSQKAKYAALGVIAVGVLMLLMSLYTTYLSSTNLKTIQAQKEMIQQNSQKIQSQINILNNQRR